MGAADWNWLFSSWIHLTMPVLLSASKHVSQFSKSGLLFVLGPSILTGVFETLCCFFGEPLFLVENVWWKLWVWARYDFMKSCLHVYVSSRGPGHPCLKELCFELFHFEFLSFGFYSFCFISSQVTSRPSLKGFFPFVILITTIFIFPSSQPKFGGSDAKDKDGIPLDIESSVAVALNYWNFL